MDLTKHEQQMLDGKHSNFLKKSTNLFVVLWEIYGTKKVIDVISVQVAGVSYNNLSNVGFDFFSKI